MKASEQYLSGDDVYYAVQGGSVFSVCEWYPKEGLSCEKKFT